VPDHNVDAECHERKEDEQYNPDQDSDKLRRSFCGGFGGLSDPEGINKGVGEKK
jgi:hypothetical protein